ncbi:hypothetical protein FGO68_gene2511 [Halteria grandinella]|uniref:Rab-GAP TBC domain-containing protein n=1 Tax=Halteria grandinella TaxID=5974 RepID=A0A8J8P3N8_HALGN|nr:hypothetical protein FGO68_gene2511 [Halteria grandinella]
MQPHHYTINANKGKPKYIEETIDLSREEAKLFAEQEIRQQIIMEGNSQMKASQQPVFLPDAIQQQRKKPFGYEQTQEQFQGGYLSSNYLQLANPHLQQHRQHHSDLRSVAGQIQSNIQHFHRLQRDHQQQAALSPQPRKAGESNEQQVVFTGLHSKTSSHQIEQVIQKGQQMRVNNERMVEQQRQEESKPQPNVSQGQTRTLSEQKRINKQCSRQPTSYDEKPEQALHSQAKLQKFTQSVPNPHKLGGPITGRQQEVVGREITVQSFRDKDNMLQITCLQGHPTNNYDSVNPFEVQDLLRSHIKQSIPNTSLHQRPSEFFSALKQPSQAVLNAQKLVKEANLGHSTGKTAVWRYLQPNNEPNGNMLQFGGAHSKTMQGRPNKETDFQRLQILEGDNSLHYTNEEEAMDTQREEHSMISRPQARSVERNGGRGAAVQKEIVFKRNPHYEEYGVKNDVKGQQMQQSQSLVVGLNAPSNLTPINASQGKKQSWQYSTNNGNMRAQMYLKDHDESHRSMAEDTQQATTRRGVSQAVAKFTSNSRMSQLTIASKYNRLDNELTQSFVMIEPKLVAHNRSSAGPLNEQKGLKPNNQDSKQASEAGNQQSGEEEKPKFSISNFGNSLFSKFTNIFTKEEVKQESIIQQEQIQLPEPIEIKRPKYLCSCGVHPYTPYMCSQSFEWYSLHNKRARKHQTITPEEYLKLKNTYLNILSQRDENKETDNQINRDLLRTFPLHSYYQEGSKGIEKMRRVLTAFSQYDLQVDYVQGMNFIVGALLYHANEVMAFWLFVSLIEDCEMRDIYMNGLPGLFKHSHIISSLISTNMFELAEHFAEHNLKVEMYASDWIFGLFASVIPLEQMGSFFTQFFAHKWIFFYQLILSILKTLQKELLQEDELWNILNQIKSQTFQNPAAVGSTGLSPGGKRNKKYLQQSPSSSSKTYNHGVYSPSQQTPVSIIKNQEAYENRDQNKVVALFKRIFRGRRDSDEDDDLSQFWPILIEKAMKEWRDQVDEQEINQMLKNFDPDDNGWRPQ